MSGYLGAFLDRFDYPREAKEFLTSSFAAIKAAPTACGMFDAAVNRYKADHMCEFGSLFRENKAISDAVGIPVFTVDLLILIALSEELRTLYGKENIDLSIWHNSMCDLLYKCIECKLVYGIWGTFVTWWFDGFYTLDRFGLGRLQFETVRFGSEYKKNGVTLTPDSTVINVHIPRTGTRLDADSRAKSYRLAADFFRERKGIDSIFMCESWLLFPRHLEMCSGTSNIRAFMNDYDIIGSGYYDGYAECWRLFDMLTDDISKLPTDTSLRRSYIDMMKRGEPVGWGKGVFVYDNQGQSD